MRSTLIGLAAAILLPGAGIAEAELSVEVGLALAGTPLTVEVRLDGIASDQTLPVELWLDGRAVERYLLEPGATALELPVLPSGRHRLEIRGGDNVAVASFRILPGWLSLLPPLLAIGLALLTRDVLVSLFLGIFGGALIVFDWNPIAAFARSIDAVIVPALADPDHISIVVFTTLLGGMVGLITRSGGTHGIIRLLMPYATDPRRGQLATWAMGVLIFFDDYANTLIVGPTMRPITDRLRISREKLAYIVDSTAAPVVCLFPISTWVGFEIGLIGDAFDRLDLPFDAYGTFLSSIPYRFYPIFALVLGFTIAATRFDFGPMRRAEERAAREGLLLPKGAVPIADYSSEAIEPPEAIPKRAANAFLPILTVIVVTILGLYWSGASGLERAAGEGTSEWLRRVFEAASSTQALLWASFSGVLAAFLLPLAQRLLTLRQAVSAMVEGFKAMMMALIVLTLAWGLSGVCDQLHTADYLVGITKSLVAPLWLPTLTFLLSAAIAFATGSSWGTMGIVEPLIIPIAHTLAIGGGHEPGSPFYMAVLVGSIASVLAGAVWGDHCSPISDTTILSSMATGCDHVAHVRTQLPYALAVGGVGILIGSLPAAMGFPAWGSLLVGSAVIVGLITAVGRRRGAAGAAG